MARLSDGGVQGHANREDMVDMVYLPISMGYRNCYKQYMYYLGYKIRCKPDGAKYIVDGIIDGEPSDHSYVSFLAYYNKWKREYSQLKVSRPAEDICNHVFVFANCHRYLTNHSTTETLATMVMMAAAATAIEATMTESTTADKNNNDGNTMAAATTTEAMYNDSNTTATATMMEAMDDDGNVTAAVTTTEAMDDDGNTTAVATTMEAMTKESTMANEDDDDGNTMVLATTIEAMDDNNNTTAVGTMAEAMITESTMADKDDDDDDNDDDTAATRTERTLAPISIDQPESAATEVEEAHEQLLLDAAKLKWQGNRELFIRCMLQKLPAMQPMANCTPSEGIHCGRLWPEYAGPHLQQ